MIEQKIKGLELHINHLENSLVTLSKDNRILEIKIKELEEKINIYFLIKKVSPIEVIQNIEL